MSKRRKKICATLLLGFLALLLICVLLWKYVFIIRNVEVKGVDAEYSEEIIRSSKISFGKSIFNLDAVSIRRAINDTGDFGFVAAEVRYPSKVILKIEKREGAAMLLHAGKVLLLDSAGNVLRALTETPDADLVYVTGLDVRKYRIGEVLDADAVKIEAYQQVLGALIENAASIYVSELNLSDSLNLKIITRTGITVQLGNSNKMVDKIAWMKSSVSDLENRGENNGYLDVSSGSKADYRSVQ